VVASLHHTSANVGEVHGYPRLVVDVSSIGTRARCLVELLNAGGLELVGVTKCVDGEPSVGQAMLAAGAAGLADSRLPSLARLAAQGLAPLTLIRAPQPDELRTLAQVADRVTLSDPDAAAALSDYSTGAPLGILLSVDLGDRREGVLPQAAPAIARRLSRLARVELLGISVNFACLSGQLPTVHLFHQAEDVLATVARECGGEPLLSLGGTCCLQHLRDYTPRFRTEIRSGGGPIYGYDFVTMADLGGLQRQDPTLSAVVLECYQKPPAPTGARGRDALGHVPDVHLPATDAWYALLGVGRRDCDPGGLRPLLGGAYLAGATSDVSVLIVPEPLSPGDVVSFAVSYDALVVAMTSPFVTKEFISSATPGPAASGAAGRGRRS
jgi:ornithine racemase